MNFDEERFERDKTTLLRAFTSANSVLSSYDSALLSENGAHVFEDNGGGWCLHCSYGKTASNHVNVKATAFSFAVEVTFENEPAASAGIFDLSSIPCEPRYMRFGLSRKGTVVRLEFELTDDAIDRMTADIRATTARSRLHRRPG